MNWRPWIFEKLTTQPVLSVIPAASVFSGGALTSVPATRPFIIYRLNEEVNALGGDDRSNAQARTAEVWVHDDPGSYDRIDSILRTVKDALEGPVPEFGANSCRWRGESPELADDGYNTVVRYATFQLIGAIS